MSSKEGKRNKVSRKIMKTNSVKISKTCKFTGDQVYSLPGVTDEMTQQGIEYIFQIAIAMNKEGTLPSRAGREEIRRHIFREMVRAYAEILREKLKT